MATVNADGTVSGRGLKLRGEYMNSIDGWFYEVCPKAVFAAIAVAPLLNGAISGVGENTPTIMLAREWVLLHEQGLVDSKPPVQVRNHAAKYVPDY